ncbi:MAG TPA: TrkH family potassium uptake protein, partial [Sediminispirochaeta sp.]|nr:TrkH family potassium uptake protein [Sediminispirochaeta sp.]
MKHGFFYLLSTLLLSIVALFVEFALPGSRWAEAVYYLDFLILFLLLLELASQLRSAPFLGTFLRENIPQLLFLLVFVALFFYNKIFFPGGDARELSKIGFGVVFLRNIFILLKVFSRLKRLSSFFESISAQPAQTILFSFLMVILTGALALMMPFSTVDGQGLNFLDALFTATSAVCVTGLIVVDTATFFTVWGQLIILSLIQIGGLSIMVISYFTIFSVRQKVSFQDKLLLSYMLSEQNISMLARRLRIIIVSTLSIEAIGAMLLWFPFRHGVESWQQGLLWSVFHSVSAFCNAGFALFSNSMEDYVANPLVSLTIPLLIIMGGISFAVISDIFQITRSRIKALFKPGGGPHRRIALNSYVVAVATPILIITGMFLFYGLEHSRSLAELETGTQYLASFFQSVTLRTAGFNTVSIAELSVTTLLVMVPFMFIGAASGSTAGGIKINNLAVILVYLKSVLLSRDSVILRAHSIDLSHVNKAFLVFFFGIFSITLGTIVLSLSEAAPLEGIIFEVVSAFGTVGLSTGLTSELSSLGKGMIILLMFVGRLGPLTILAAAAQPAP